MVFPKKDISSSQEEDQEDLASVETLGRNSSPQNKRLFPIPEELTTEQLNWLGYESNLPEKNSWWSDEVYPAFKAYCISKNRTFKTEDNFRGGCLEYGLNRYGFGIGVNKFGGVLSVEE